MYEARQEPLERRVALKTLHADHAQRKEAIARFFNEAKVLSRLEHPSIVQVSDFGHAADGTAYLVMEYLRGQSLGHRIRALSERGERLPVATALQVCVQVASVLVVAHAQCIVHRDLKPPHIPSRNKNGPGWGKRREKRANDPSSTFGSQSLHRSF